MIDDTTKCPRCDGRGVSVTDLRKVGFGEGFAAFMSSCRQVYDPDGRFLGTEIVCPRCDGSGKGGGAEDGR